MKLRAERVSLPRASPAFTSTPRILPWCSVTKSTSAPERVRQ